MDLFVSPLLSIWYSLHGSSPFTLAVSLLKKNITNFEGGPNTCCAGARGAGLSMIAKKRRSPDERGVIRKRKNNEIRN
jgi:hypothetical protein